MTQERNPALAAAICCTVVLLVLVALLYTVSTLVFGTTSLVQAAAHPANNRPCEYDMVVWVLVYGVVVWAAVGLNVVFFVCTCGARRTSCLGRVNALFNTLIGLFLFAWSAYGTNMALTRGGELGACDADFFYWFSLAAQFGLWLVAACIVLLPLLVCMFACVFEVAELEKIGNPEEPVQEEV